MFELLAYLLRSDAMLMIQPLGVLTFTAFYFMKNKLYRIKGLSVKEWMGKCRPLFYTAGILLGILALGKGSYLIFYSSEGWKEYEKVIGALMDITDYADIPDYEDVADILEKYGVTEKQYSAFGQYMMIEENLSGDCLLEVAEVAGRQEIRPELSQLGSQKVKIDGFYKIILIKTGFRIFFKFIHRDVKPDRLAEVELVSDCFQSAEYLMGSGIVAVVANNGIFYEMVVFNNFCP